jgi:hypothetical protein
MPYFHKKTLQCGCIILAFRVYKVNDAWILGGHDYYNICNKCKLNFSEELVDEILEDICSNDDKTSKNVPNNLIEICVDYIGHFTYIIKPT